MADKRKPDYVFLLKNTRKRKTNKVELFSSRQWGVWGSKLRVRVNGKWFDGKRGEMTFYYKTEIRNMIFRSIKL